MLLVLLMTCVGVGAAAAAVAAPTVTTRLGKITGAHSSAPAVAAFKGIPYAEPPTHRRRWQPPVPKSAWSPATLNATAFGTVCIQGSHVDHGFGEDCLFLNVYTPLAVLPSGSGADIAKGLPVMLWIHGGSYTSGASNQYPGESLVAASENTVIVVTINYRLNVFGFLGSKEIKARNPTGTAGNCGIEDQRLAMMWVQQNIDAFGGDPDQVTIFGESAGGNSVINHLAQPASFPLYTKAIIESGAYDTGAQPLATAQSQYEALLGHTNCSDLDCLLLIDAATVEKASQGGWGPTIDGVNLVAAPTDLIAQGSYNSKVPVLIGSNRDEMAYFTISEKVPNQLTEVGMDVLLLDEGLNRSTIQALKAVYDPDGDYPYPANLGNYSIWYWMSMRITTDSIPGLGACAVRWFDRMLLAGKTPAVYSYLYAHPDQETFVPGTGPGSVFVPHAAEILYVFGCDETAGLNAEESALARQTATYWTNFAKTGDPNGAGPHWPKYDAQADTVIRLDVASGGGVVMQSGLRKAACDFQSGE